MPGMTKRWPVGAGHDGAKVIKITSSNCKQLELDLILFIVQLGATGPPRYTLILKPNPIA